MRTRAAMELEQGYAYAMQKSFVFRTSSLKSICPTRDNEKAVQLHIRKKRGWF